jgi:hypothetical protein
MSRPASKHSKITTTSAPDRSTGDTPRETSTSFSSSGVAGRLGYRVRAAVHSRHLHTCRGGALLPQTQPIDDSLARHVIWHETARALLGLPAAQPPFTDYICAPVAWSPSIVTALVQRVEQVTGRPWADAIGSQLHFSEATRYGVFVDHVLGAPAT